MAVAALLLGCGSRSQKKAGENDAAQTEANAGIHNARTSLDYQGTYRGVIPYDEGRIDLTVTITDKEYTRTVFPEGRPGETQTTSGTFEWSGDSEIMLDGFELPDRFFVAENSLIVLDEQGNRPEGEDAAKWILAKQQ